MIKISWIINKNKCATHLLRPRVALHRWTIPLGRGGRSSFGSCGGNFCSSDGWSEPVGHARCSRWKGRQCRWRRSLLDHIGSSRRPFPTSSPLADPMALVGGAGWLWLCCWLCCGVVVVFFVWRDTCWYWPTRVLTRKKWQSTSCVTFGLSNQSKIDPA